MPVLPVEGVSNTPVAERDDAALQAVQSMIMPAVNSRKVGGVESIDYLQAREILIEQFGPCSTSGTTTALQHRSAHTMQRLVQEPVRLQVRVTRRQKKAVAQLTQALPCQHYISIMRLRLALINAHASRVRQSQHGCQPA